MIPWSTRAQIIYRRSYSRPLNEDSTEFEQWPQTIERVIRHQAWLWERAKGMNLDKKEREELDELKQLMLERKGYVSGRTLWLGGTEISRTRESCNFNCLKKSTKFITINGVKSFEDFEDGNEVTVWTHKGQWKKAVVRCYGKQKLYNIEFSRNFGTPTIVSATLDHRWLLHDGTETTKLCVGDKLARPISVFNDWSWDEAEPIVRAINPDVEEDVWCLEVEDDHSFTLANGIVTGNCSNLSIKTVFDIVDALWLLLQGAGVGFTPITGILNGFIKPIPEIEVIRSTRTFKGGAERNTETWLSNSKTWILQVGDSAKAWAKVVGKLVAGKYPAKRLVLDLSQIRPAGERLRGYGWISSGDEQLSKALLGICSVLNKAAGRLLTEIDILDVMNWLGSVLSSRRSAELALLPHSSKHWREFAVAKKDHFEHNPQRSQSNNSLVLYEKPSKSQLFEIFDLMLESGGSEPGLVNGEAALRRAPYFRGLNPCSEVLLGDHSFCNLVEIVTSHFNGDFDGLVRAIYIMARANYRQTCVNLDDGVLQRTWHELNEYLHLCGVGLTGIVEWDRHQDKTALQLLRAKAREGADSMADELDLPYSANVTVIKPSGSLSKISDCTEGVHKPLGKYIFNNINFSKHDPLVKLLEEAGYNLFENPYDATGVIVTFPVLYDNVEFTEIDGKWVNVESAIEQLERYKLLMDHYVDNNVSITISYSPGEIGKIVDWLYENWDSYVACAFMFRNDPMKTAADFGYPYLPQEVVTEEKYWAYVKTLKPVNFENADGDFELDSQECRSGMCPIK